MNFTEFNQSDRCLYVTCEERTGSFVLYILQYIFAAAVVLITVCGNLLVIVSAFHMKKLHTPTNVLVMSLAVMDFLIGALVMPPMFIWTIETCWIFSPAFCIYIMFIGTVFMCLSIDHIVLIALDRYFALSNPFHYNNIMSLRKTRVVIFLQWCVWMGYSLALLYFNGNLNLFPVCTGECLIILNDVLVIIDLITTLLFPCTVIIILYTGVFVIAKKHVTAIREINNLTRSQTHTNSIRSERKAAKVLGILVAVFLTCLLPYYVYSLFSYFIELKIENIQIVLIFFHINSTINPVIYALFYPWFRRSVKKLLHGEYFRLGLH